MLEREKEKGGAVKKGKATLREVARLAGVSHTAGLRAVNGLPGLSEETRERILSVVSQTGYKPDPHLGAFFHRVRRSSRTISLLRRGADQTYGHAVPDSLSSRQESAILDEARKAAAITSSSPASRTISRRMGTCFASRKGSSMP